MIAIGVAPGIRSAAYCALEWDGEGPALVLDREVMSRPRILRGEPKPPRALLRQRFHCHWLILTTVWDRHHPKLLAIGPPADPREPIEHAIIAGTVISELGALMGVDVVSIDRGRMSKVFGETTRRIRSTVGRCVESLPRDPRALVATAAAVYALSLREPRLLPEH